MPRTFESVGNTVRFLSASGDLAYPFIQGLPQLAENPRAWAKMALNHHKAMFDPTVQARFTRDNLETFQKMARNGVEVGDADFFKALRNEGEIPALGRAIDSATSGLAKPTTNAIRKLGRQTYQRAEAAYATGQASA